jgi:hypothetical protein
MKLALFALALAPAALFAQTAASVTPNPNIQFLDTSTGAALPCVGCSVYTYAAGTSTPLATYTDSTGMTANSNPIVLDSAGYSTSGIWIKASCYKFVLENASAATVWTQDNVCDNSQLLKTLLAGSTGAAQIGYEASGGAATNVAAVLNVTPRASDYSSLAVALTTISAGQTLTVPAGTYAIPTAVTVSTANIRMQCQPGAVIQAATSNYTALSFTGANPVVDGCTFDGRYSQSSYTGVTFIGGAASNLTLSRVTFTNANGNLVNVPSGSVSLQDVTVSDVGDGTFTSSGYDAIVLGTGGSGSVANLTRVLVRNMLCSGVTGRDCLHILVQDGSAALTGTIDGFAAYNQAPYAAMEVQGNPATTLHLHNILCDNMPHGGDCVSGFGGGQETIDGIVALQPVGASVTAGSVIEAYPAQGLNVSNMNVQGAWSDALAWDGIVHMTNAQIGTIGVPGLPLNTSPVFVCNVSASAPNNIGCQGSTFDGIQVAESYTSTFLSGDASGGTTDGIAVSNVSVVRTPGVFGSADTGWTAIAFGNGGTGNGTIHYTNVSCVIEAASIPSGFGFDCFAGYSNAIDVDGASLINYNATPFGQMYVDGSSSGLTGSSFRHLRVTNFAGSSISASDVIHYADNLCLQGTNTNACGAAGGPGVDFTITNIPLTYSQLENAAGNAGNTHQITDANTTTWGTTVSGGGGSDIVGIRSNGTNWTVFAQ